jgi:eukaryotic-like serine/threonine-protein kinase
MKHCPQCQQTYAGREQQCPVDGAWLTLRDPYHLVGQTLLGKYRVEALVGVGGMGAVYRAFHLALERPLALKILQPEKALANEQWLRLFEREARLAARLQHENIAAVLDAGRTDDGIAYIAMEWLEGVTLQEELNKSGPFSFARSAEILEQLAAALAVAHAAQIVHRDLKPANVMLIKNAGAHAGNYAQVKVLDFGIAKVTSAALGTAVSAPLGTPQYASPEQFQAGQVLDARSDIYSLGVLLYQMLTGALPFTAASLPELIKLQTTAPPPPLRRLRPDAPLALEQLLNHLLAKDPAQRPAQVSAIPLLFRRALGTHVSEPDTCSAATELETQPLATATAGELSDQPATTPIKSATAAIPAAASQPLTVKFARHRAYWLSLGVTLLLGGSWLWWRNVSQPATTTQPIKTLAVLPFKALVAETADPALNYGLTDALITRLSNLRQIAVRPTSAVLKYAQGETDARRIARELEVDALLTGSIQRTAERVRVTVQLLSAQAGTPQWAATFDERTQDLLRLQDALAAQTAAALVPQLTGAERQLLVKRETENPVAAQLYSKARFQWETRSQEGFKRSIELIQQALEQDPNYALAHAGLASSYTLFSMFGFLPPHVAMPKAAAAAKHALELEETLAEAHIALGMVKANYDWDWDGAERELRRALELNPNHPGAHHAYALLLAAQTRFGEAHAELERGQQLDPRSLNITAARAWVYYLARDYQQAATLVEENLPLNPNFYPLLQQLAQARERQGRYTDAVRIFEHARQRSGGSTFAVARLGHAYALAGQRQAAQARLAELKESTNRAYGVAWVYLGLGDHVQALTWLERACDDHASEMIYLKADSLYDALRGEPRFRALLQRVGLPD